MRRGEAAGEASRSTGRGARGEEHEARSTRRGGVTYMSTCPGILVVVVVSEEGRALHRMLQPATILCTAKRRVEGH